MNLNTLLLISCIVVFIVVIVVAYFRSKHKTTKVEIEEFRTLNKVTDAVKNEMVDIVKEDITLGISKEEFDRLYRRKARINEALKNCVHGVDSAKALVIDLIRNFISAKLPESQLDAILGLDAEGEPSNQVKFEILMYKFKKQYQKDALIKWIDKYNLNRERQATGADRIQDLAYYITVEDLSYSYAQENIKLSHEEKIDILSVLVYQQYKGFGIIDTVREMNINGLNIGTSGSILNIANSDLTPKEFKANNSVWLYDRGRYIHLRFLNFGTEEEARRIIQLICRWGNPGPLTSKRGYLVNTMYDKSRVLAVRPPVSEYWAVFIRKFTISDPSPEYLIAKEYTHNAHLAIKLIEFLMRGCITCAVTGRQGSGKTTLMSSIIRYIDPRYTLRVLEMAPELYLREIYPSRNVLSLQETATVSAAEAQDALKKSDAAVSIVGEVATDSIAARMIQMGMTASIFTIFSHHANTPKDLVLTLRNSLVNDGGFSNMETAEKQVTDVVKVDIHLDYTTDGKRYISRISEIVQLEEGVPYPEYDSNDPVNSMNRITAEYYKRKTDRVGFTTRTILTYDVSTHTYHTAQRFSPYLAERIRTTLGDEIACEFDKFMLENWKPEDGSTEANMPKAEISEKIKELDRIIADNNSKRENINREIEAKMYNQNTYDKNETSDEIQNNAAEKAMWANGYIPDDSTPTVNGRTFGIGEFISNDDYKK